MSPERQRRCPRTARAGEARPGRNAIRPGDGRWERYGALTILSMTTPCVGTLVAVYESVEVPRSFWA
jgi:hypothetical protein